MTHRAPSHDLRLEHRCLYTLNDAAGVEVSCLEGTIWLTIDNDPQDYVLEPGERFRISERRRVVLYALRAARVTFTALQCENPSMASRNKVRSSSNRDTLNLTTCLNGSDACVLSDHRWVALARTLPM